MKRILYCPSCGCIKQLRGKGEEITYDALWDKNKCSNPACRQAGHVSADDIRKISRLRFVSEDKLHELQGKVCK